MKTSSLANTASDRTFNSYRSLYTVSSPLHKACQSYTRNIPGASTSTASITRSATGLETLGPVCSGGTRIGEGRYVRFDAFIALFPINLSLIVGLAVNFLLIESLQRFYQYYGDELQASDTDNSILAC